LKDNSTQHGWIQTNWKTKKEIPMHKITLMLIICFSVVLVCNVIEAELLMLDDFKNGKINDRFWRKEGGVKAVIDFAVFKIIKHQELRLNYVTDQNHAETDNQH
jgi:hypothetical protein